MRIRFDDRRDYLHYCCRGLYWLMMFPIIPIAITGGLFCWFVDWYKEKIYNLTNWY